METLNQQPVKVALVALDLTEMDDHLIQYTGVISSLLALDRIFFVHVAKQLELPKEIISKYPDLLAPLDESIEMDIQKKVEKHVGSDTEVTCIVNEGHTIAEILKISRIKNVDLIVMGRKVGLKGSGIVSGRIARKCSTSLILVTEKFETRIRKILVPLDFSRSSLLAVKQALKLAENASSKVLFSHVYGVPTGFYKTGKSYEEFAEIMESNAREEDSQFRKKYEIPDNIPCEYLLTNDGKHDELIYNYAKKADVDLIVIGSRGRTEASAVLLGSLAERLVFKNIDIPIFIVKRKGENMGFLDALMKV